MGVVDRCVRWRYVLGLVCVLGVGYVGGWYVDIWISLLERLTREWKTGVSGERERFVPPHIYEGRERHDCLPDVKELSVSLLITKIAALYVNWTYLC